ncbi:MAG: hypothetical protein GYB33_19150 [Gammaproteobacteria bacterium]|nr:hypothetical protein [Gammaproteobacteria bacterium]
MKTATLIFALLTVSLAACSSTHPYQRAQGSGFGYKESAISTDRYRVHYKARGNDTAEAMDMALLRAAELTLLEGYDWFVVVDREQISERNRTHHSGSSFSGNSFSASRQQEVVRDCGLLGCTTYTRPGTRYSMGINLGDSAGYNGGRSHVESILEIRMGKGERPQQGDSYAAYEVSRRLKDAHEV